MRSEFNRRTRRRRSPLPAYDLASIIQLVPPYAPQDGWQDFGSTARPNE